MYKGNITHDILGKKNDQLTRETLHMHYFADIFRKYPQIN